MRESYMFPLVTTEWLESQISSSSDIVVLDATYFLPNEIDVAEATFKKQHIPGAKFLPLKNMSDPSGIYPNTVPDEKQFSSVAGGLGVDNLSTVIVYDQRGIFSSARVWWLFRLFGHTKVAVLDGGLPKWIKEGRPVEEGTLDISKQGNFVSQYKGDWLVSTDAVNAKLSLAECKILDARSAERFSGKTAELRSGVRAGHIPGSHNIPYSALLTSDGTLVRLEHLRDIFKSYGLLNDDYIITTCGSGVTAAIVLLALEVAGYKTLTLYDGSWTEWGSRSDLPIELG